MSLSVTAELMSKTTHQAFSYDRTTIEKWNDRTRDIQINTIRLKTEALQDLVEAAKAVEDRRTVRALEAMIAARDGDVSKSVPNFDAFQEMLLAFLRKDAINGWIYVERRDGNVYPELVVGVEQCSDRFHKEKWVEVKTAYYGLDNDKLRHSDETHRFAAADVTRKTVAMALEAKGMMKETRALKAQHDEEIQRYIDRVQDGFGQQYKGIGLALEIERAHDRKGELDVAGHKMIHDMKGSEAQARSFHNSSQVFNDEESEVPVHPITRLFDLKSHSTCWVHANHLEPYVYDKKLGDKIVLPSSHRDLLDVLTSDLDAFVEDIVEGKSAGNVILCKGLPGVGKTLTAEVYAELIEKPLYAMHAGHLGTTAEDVGENLRETFDRALRWGCVLLLDEADVFVVKRGNNIEQNAIVAEFLRSMEYFTGLMFMTTNRPDDIDEAILSRCAAVIGYELPTAKDSARIWRIMAKQNKAELSDGTIDTLVKIFPDLAPRDIKMLLRLALRMANKRNLPLEADLFRKMAMFRNVRIASIEGD